MKNIILAENSSLKIIMKISKNNNIYNLVNNYLNYIIMKCYKLKNTANNFNINKDMFILFNEYLKLLRY